jgi:Amidases related to nicotinamidase
MYKVNILVVIDMQNDFIDGSLGTKEAVAIIPNVIKKIKNFQGEILVTKDTHQNEYLNTLEGKKLPVVHCIKDTNGWELNGDIEKALSDRGGKVFQKPTFGSVELAEYIKELIDNKNIEASAIRIELIGVCTDICVISNSLLLKAYFPEANIIVDSDCCAGVTPDTHNNALEAMKMCQIEVL